MKIVDYDYDFQPQKTNIIIVTPTLPRHCVKETSSLKQKIVAFKPVPPNKMPTTASLSPPPIVMPVISPVKLEFLLN